MSVTEGTVLRLVASMVFPDDVIMMNVFHFVLTTIVGDGDPATVGADAIEYIEALYADVGNEISDGIDANELAIYEYDPVDEDFDEVITVNWADTFIDTADPLPHGVALVQNFKTTDPDVDGRKYWGGYTEGDQVAGSWVALALTHAIATAVKITDQFTATVSANVYTPGVWSPTTLNFFAYTGTVFTNAIVGYQRRRKPGVGI